MGSHFITRPSPPPYGSSSVVRWRSWVQSRRSCALNSRMPFSWAMRIMEEPMTEAYMSGNVDSVSMITGGPFGLSLIHI